MEIDYDIVIIGAGLVGLTTALACASKNCSVLIIDHVHPKTQITEQFDGRASAVAASSYRMFEKLGVLKDHADHIEVIRDVLISDGEVGKETSPLSLHFDSTDMDNPSGYMIENRRLRAALLKAVDQNPDITLNAPAIAESWETHPSYVEINIDDVALTAQLIVAADGRNSQTRAKAGISVTRVPYKQKAIVTTVLHELPLNGTAHEIFYPQGPFAILPLTDNRANIVWTDKPEAVTAAMSLSEPQFDAELRRRFGDFLGLVSSVAPRWSYPLSLQMVEKYVSERVVLVGDAAHVIHPIAGQGLNMGLRDAAALADVIANAKSLGLDIASQLENYARWRSFDNNMLAGATDMFNRFFSNNIAPVKHVRRLGLGMVDKLSPLRSFFMREASGELGDLPTLLR